MAGVALGANYLRFAGNNLHPLAYPRHPDIDRSIKRVPVTARCGVEQLLSGQQSIWTARNGGQKIELCRHQENLVAIGIDLDMVVEI